MNASTRPTEGRRVDVLTALKKATAPMSIVELADDLQVHPNTVRFHLHSLVRDGLVERVEPDQRRPGRPPQMFRAVHRMNPGGPRRYRTLAEILALGLTAEPDPSTKALEAGRAWGRTLRQPAGKTEELDTAESVGQLVDVLDELGFEPELRTGPDDAEQVGLRHCPFLELAEVSSSVVCPVHLGIMQGALETWGAPVTVDQLDAFVEPDLCLAHLTSRRS